MANYRAMARRAALRAGIDPRVFLRQIAQESGFNPNARSSAGALGIAQIMPSTAAGWHVDPMNPQAALRAAAQHMAGYLRAYHGDWRLALAAYNAGPGAVAKYHGVPPYAQTQSYVHSILAGLATHGRVRSTGGLPPGRAPIGGGHPGQAFLPAPQSFQPISVPAMQISPMAQLASTYQAPSQSSIAGSLGMGVQPLGAPIPQLTPSGYSTSDLYSQLADLRQRLLK